MKQLQLQEAKARLSEWVSKVSKDGPYEITVHGRAKAVLLPAETYDRLKGVKKESWTEFVRRSPLRGDDHLVIERDRSLPRDVKF